MLCIKKPSVVEAYIFGVDEEAMPFVRGGESGFFVITIRGLIIKVIKGDYIIPESHNSLSDPRAISVNPKIFKIHYKEVDYADAEVIQNEE